MSEAILLTMALFLGFVGIYYLLEYRATKKVWRRKVESWYTSGQKRKSFIVLLGDRFDQTPFAAKMEKKLKKANLFLTPSEFYGLLFVVALALTLIVNNVLHTGLFLSFLLSIILVQGIQFLLFIARSNKYQHQLSSQLPEICRLLANATRSGMTVQQGIDLVAKEMNYPANEEFKRLSHEMRLGVDFDRAMIQLQNRVDSRDFKLFIATLQIQKRAGGNLSEVLEEMSITLEERKILHQTIKTMTAEQRYIAWILPLMPILVIFIMNSIVEGFIEPLFSVVGAFLLVIFVASTIITYFLIKKVTDIRV
ncbi:type II secretion system F family protein [Halalkalibacter urbisdiaboli]|uniref:type II secretion system F family protein n=1 Tax=Halalkalibacter urbisdiaboli TaxID=1960589 RepID=UPI000B4420F0|nr:type II secretion system F family protein [Halalkalibacter urbisdiaboli]